MFNVKTFTYPDGTKSYRVFKNPVPSGEDIREAREEAKRRLLESNRLELDILRYYGKDLPDFISEDDFLASRPMSDYSLMSDVEKSNFIAAIASSRSKKVIYELARSNNWEYFVTITFDPKEIDSTDYDLVSRKVSVWLNNQKRSNPNLKYLFIPELHKDGKKYHFHGLLENYDPKKLVFSGHYNDFGDPIYNLKSFKFGFTNVSRIRSRSHVCIYVTKYITKEINSHIFGKRRYLSSNNLQRAEIEYNMLSDDEINELLINSDILTMKTVKNQFNQINYFEIDKS